MGEDDWLDDQLLSQDHASTRGWRRRSLGGLSVADCMMALPIYGQFQIRLPIEGFRQFKQWCETENISMHVFARQAIKAALENHPRASAEMIKEMSYDR
jgi:hypothetical protein